MNAKNKKVACGAALVSLSAVVPNLKVFDFEPYLFSNLVGKAHAQASSKTTLNIKAKISNPLKISATNPTLAFGTFATGGAGKYEVTVSGGVGATSKAVVINNGFNLSLSFEAPTGATFSLSITNYAAGNIKLRTAAAGGATPSKTLSVKTMVLRGKASAFFSPNTKTYKSGSNKFGGFRLKTAFVGMKMQAGATIHFSGNQVVGTYTGQFVIVQNLI